MKITGTTKGKANTVETPFSGKSVSNTSNDSFVSKLGRVEAENHEAKISDLLDKIALQAQKLTNKVDISELKMYKRLVSAFLDEAVNNSHKFTKENKLDRRGRNRVYAIVKMVNDNLESLTQEVLKEEKDNLAILNRLDDIRGLLMDIST